MNPDFQIIQPNELRAPNLPMTHRQALLMAANIVGFGLGTVTVAVQYPEKQTDTEPRLPGRDYISIPGVGPDVHLGTLHVGRRVDNAANRRAGVVGKVKLSISSLMRPNGVDASRPTGVCMEGLTSFVITGFRPTVPVQQDAAQAPEQGA